MTDDTAYTVPRVLTTSIQIPDVLFDLVEALESTHGGLHLAGTDEAAALAWGKAQPETRACILLSAAWSSKGGQLPATGDGPAEQLEGLHYASGLLTAEQLHQWAEEESDTTAFHGTSFPIMPLPGRAGALASSVGFDRDDLRASLYTALILLKMRRTDW